MVRLHGEEAAQFALRLLVSMRLEQDPGDLGTGNSQRIEAPAALDPLKCLVQSPLAHQPGSKPSVSMPVIRAQLERTAELGFGDRPVEPRLLRACEQHVRIGQIGIERERFTRRIHDPGPRVVRKSAHEHRAEPAEGLR